MHTITTKEQYAAFIAIWKECAHQKKLGAADMLLHGLLRHGDPTRGFTPVSRPTKLAAGMDPDGAVKRAMTALGYALEDNFKRSGWYSDGGNLAALLQALELDAAQIRAAQELLVAAQARLGSGMERPHA